LADYRERYIEIQAAGASLVAVSVDAPAASEAVRAHLGLPFPILCDTERRVVRDWDIYNAREKGGIAKPAVFIIDRDRAVRYAAVDTVIKRVAAAEIVCLLQAGAEAPPVRRRVLVPLFSNWLSAIRNSIRR
jgi:peroxiredoxin